MNKVIAITLILGVLLLIYISKPSGYDQELDKLKVKHKAEMDSVIRLCEH